MSSTAANPNRIPAGTVRRLKLESAFMKALERKDAQSRRKRTQDVVNDLIKRTGKSNAESRTAAAKARARDVLAQIDECATQSDLAVSNDSVGVEPRALSEIRIDDLQALFTIREQLPIWLRERIEKIHAKFHWQTRKGKKGYFNVAVHKNHIPIDKALTILAHLYKIPDELDLGLNTWVDAVIECGLFPRIKQGKFEYGHRCQDTERCDLCNYLDISCGLKTLFGAYSPRTFRRGCNWFAITVAPRTERAKAKAIGHTLSSNDWDYANQESAVYWESRQGRAFVYPSPFDDGLTWHLESTIRRFLGAVQFAFGKLVKNGWLDGLRAKIENSIEFLPFKSHQHWHAVGSSRSEHDPQKMAEFIKEKVDAILVQTCSGIYADVTVSIISTPEDLRRWIKYSHKPVDLISPVTSVYNRNPGIRRTDLVFKKFFEELRLYPQRSRQIFKSARENVDDERGAHTYSLRRHFVRGNHKFGRGSILTESERHRLWRKAHRKRTASRRAHQRAT